MKLVIGHKGIKIKFMYIIQCEYNLLCFNNIPRDRLDKLNCINLLFQILFSNDTYMPSNILYRVLHTLYTQLKISEYILNYLYIFETNLDYILGTMDLLHCLV